MKTKSDPEIFDAPTAEQIFPTQREEIQHLCRSNPDFHEMCKDLELMARLCADKCSGDAAAIESFEGLKEEIKRALNKRARAG